MNRSKTIHDIVAGVYSARFDALPPFEEVLESAGPRSEAQIAETIAADVQLANGHGVEVSYYRYSRALPIDEYPLAKEAAIEAWALSLYDSDRCADFGEAVDLVRSVISDRSSDVVRSIGVTQRRRAGFAGLTHVSKTSIALGVLLAAAVIWGAYGHLRRAELAKVVDKAMVLVEQSGQTQVQPPRSRQDDSTSDD